MKDININIPSNIIFLGKTGSGKTVCFKNVYNKLLSNKKHVIFVLCPTAQYSGDYDFINKKCIITDHEIFEEKLDYIFLLAKKFIAKNKKINIYVVLDDCLGVFDFNKKKITNLIITSRHFNISFFIMLQQLTKFVEGGLRNNFKYLFVNKTNDQSNYKCLFNLTDIWDTEKECKNYLSKNNAEYNTIFIDNSVMGIDYPVVFNSNNI